MVSVKGNHEIDEITLDDSERQPCEVWTRVMGYHRPTSSFNIGKLSEHEDRKFFKEVADIKNDGLDQ